MYNSYVIIETEPEYAHKVGSRLNQFEGVIQHVQNLHDGSSILARILTDNHKRFRSFIREQIQPLQGVKKFMVLAEARP